MKQLSAILLGLLISSQVFAQKVYWANKVIQYSSQYGEKEFSAQQVLGPPNALPSYGKSLVAWAPGIKGNKASITVGFEKSIQVQQIAIGENLLAGSVEKIFLYDSKGKEHLVYHNPDPQPKNPDRAGIFNHFIPLTSYNAGRLKLELNYTNFRNIPQIDCIGISSDKRKIEAKINLPDFSSHIPNPENLGSGVNSPYHDMLPIIAPDDNTLYFARKNAPENMGVQKKDDIYVSRRLSNGSWSQAANVGTPLNTDEHNFVCAISPDGNTMYLANRYDYKTEGQGVAVSYKDKNGKWGKPKSLNIFNMYNKNKYACYHVSIDERVMVMAIERDDTYGDMDLYVSFRYADGYWSEPINMGPDLNTAGAEASVFLAADGKTIYFSSNGHSGYGDLDMFMSKRLDNSWKNWTTPVNLGNKINTPGMDVYYTIPASGEYAYYSSNRGGYGRNDIFRIKLPKELRPEPVEIKQGGLYTQKEIEIPKLKPYKEALTSALDTRIETLKNQLNQASGNTKTQEEEFDKLNEKEAVLNKDIEKLEEQFNEYEDYTPTQSAAVNYPKAGSIQYNTEVDDKINELKRKLEKVKLNHPGIAAYTPTTGSSDELSYYENKLAGFQKKDVEEVAETPKETPTARLNPQLTAYEEKLKNLESERDPSDKKQKTPTRILKRKADETDSEHNLLQNQNVYETNTGDNSLETDPNLSSYLEKLEMLESAREYYEEEQSNQEIGSEFQETGKPESEELIAKINSEDIQSATGELSGWQQQVFSLEDSLKALLAQKEQIIQKNREEQQLTDDLQKEQQELIGEKEEIALTISQMKLEREQLELEKEKLESERKKLDLLKNQQYRDIHALQKELDSLQKIQKRMQLEQERLLANTSIEEDLENLKKEVGEKYTLKNVYFVANASFIQAKSHLDLDKFAFYLKQNKNLSIEVGGHTNGLCDDAYCNQLSNKRAKAVVDYLIRKGISAERLTYKGYGKTQNIADNHTDLGRKLNQRVEITIVKVD